MHTAPLVLLPLTVSCFSKIQIGFTFVVPADPGSPVQRAIKRVSRRYSIPRERRELRYAVQLLKWRRWCYVYRKQAFQSIINPDWNFDKMGIGGLDSQFSAIFRRAFASRVFPPEVVDQLGKARTAFVIIAT